MFKKDNLLNRHVVVTPSEHTLLYQCVMRAYSPHGSKLGTGNEWDTE